MSMKLTVPDLAVAAAVAAALCSSSRLLFYRFLLAQQEIILLPPSPSSPPNPYLHLSYCSDADDTRLLRLTMLICLVLSIAM